MRGTLLVLLDQPGHWIVADGPIFIRGGRRKGAEKCHEALPTYDEEFPGMLEQNGAFSVELYLLRMVMQFSTSSRLMIRINKR